MTEPNQPQEPTQVVPPAPPADPPPAYPPTVYPPAAPEPAYPPAPPPSGFQPQSWTVAMEPVGPAPGVQFASHGARLVAYIVDAILLGVLATAVAIALALLTAGLAAAGAVPLAALSGLILFVAVFAVSLGYFPWFWVHGGATPGMRIFNLRVVRDADGGPIGWGAAIMRLFGFWVSSLVLYLGFVWIFVDARRRGWHDLIAGTVMVQPA